jgi:hypothetical protein
MKRREFITLRRHGRSAQAPSRGRKSRVSASSMTRLCGRPFGRHLRELGYVEGQTVSYEYPYSEGAPTAWRRWWAN